MVTETRGTDVCPDCVREMSGRGPTSTTLLRETLRAHHHPEPDDRPIDDVPARALAAVAGQADP